MRRWILTGCFALLAVAGPADADREPGITLFRDTHFEGAYHSFHDGEEIPSLGDLRTIGNDSVSSIRVDPGCRVTLYEDEYFRGEAVTLEGDVADLRATRIGHDSASSIRVECRGRYGRGSSGRPGWYGGGDSPRPGYFDDDRRGDGRDGRYDRYDWRGRPGVILYSDEGFRGRQEAFYGDDPRLTDNPIRQDTVSSVRVGSGCRVVLYEHTEFRGAATLLEDDAPSLKRTVVGNDRVSSIEIRCDRRGGFGVTLYEHVHFEGRYETFGEDDPALKNNFIRQDGVSSVRVSPGCIATLYEHAEYRGRSTTVREDVEDLRHTSVGNDRISSLRVDCRRRGYRRP